MITLCPNCKEYLARCDTYKFCCNCGCQYDKDKLIAEDDGKEEFKPEYLGRVARDRKKEKETKFW